jgi:hypothetical protein
MIVFPIRFDLPHINCGKIFPRVYVCKLRGTLFFHISHSGYTPMKEKCPFDKNNPTIGTHEVGILEHPAVLSSKNSHQNKHSSQ